ncbi:MAG TPA: LysR family transcriptional regulator [Acidimicrobiales bacterium]|nr:LysR family transcriptional regulator [Acidimicrobiales bacterium]
MIDVQRLKTLKAVIEHGTVVAAAGALAYTPSAISQQVAALERETGLQLFQRTSRGLRPTHAAMVLVEQASRVLGELAEVDAVVEALRKGASARVRVVAFQTASITAVPVATAQFSARFPAVQVELGVSETDLALDRVENGEVDLAVVIVPFDVQTANNTRVAYQHLLTDDFSAVVPAGHPLAAGCEIDLADLSGERWISTSGNPHWCSLIVGAACREAGFEPGYAYHGDDYAMTQALVAAGLGVALVPSLVLANGSHPGAVGLPLKGPPVQREIYAVTRAAGRPAYVDGFLGCLVAAFAEHEGDAGEQVRSA